MNPLALFAVRTATLRSPLTPQACAERVAARTDGLFNLFGERPLIGSVSPSGATLRRRLGYRNSFQTELRAAFEPAGSGTTIRCRFGLSNLVVAFMAVWVVMVLGIGATFLTSAGGGQVDGPTRAAFAVVPFGFLLFLVLLGSVGRWFARHDESLLLEAVRAATEATVAEREPGHVDAGPAGGPGENLPVFGLLGLAVVLVLGLVGAIIYFTSGLA